MAKVVVPTKGIKRGVTTSQATTQTTQSSRRVVGNTTSNDRGVKVGEAHRAKPVIGMTYNFNMDLILQMIENVIQSFEQPTQAELVSRMKSLYDSVQDGSFDINDDYQMLEILDYLIQAHLAYLKTDKIKYNEFISKLCTTYKGQYEGKYNKESITDAADFDTIADASRYLVKFAQDTGYTCITKDPHVFRNTFREFLKDMPQYKELDSDKLHVYIMATYMR